MRRQQSHSSDMLACHRIYDPIAKISSSARVRHSRRLFEPGQPAIIRQVARRWSRVFGRLARTTPFLMVSACRSKSQTLAAKAPSIRRLRTPSGANKTSPLLATLCRARAPWLP